MLELSLDFVDEDVAFLTSAQLKDVLDYASSRLQEAFGSYSGGRVIREGARIALLGAPNVGKSILLNALLGTRRAIVTDVPGTTRDYLEEAMLLHGECVRLIDTAGLRDTDDAVEQEGIAFSMNALKDADIICLLSDARDGFSPDKTHGLDEEYGARVMHVFNKSDLVDAAGIEDLRAHGIAISAIHGGGLDELTRTLAEQARSLRGSSEQGSVLVTNARHADCLRRGLASLDEARRAQQAGMTEEVLSAELRQAIDALGEIIGLVTTDDILNGIFSRLCIGK